MFVSALRALDRILRGEATRLAELRTGRLDIPLRQVVPVLLVLAALYGAAMGLFATLHGGHPQAAVNLFKVPALFVLTLLVTFPSLYVFNTLVGSRLSARTLLNMICVALGVLIVVLASLAPILIFFSFSTRSHPFMVLLNTVHFGIAAVWGRSFLRQTMHGLLLSDPSTRCDRVQPADDSPDPAAPAAPLFEDTPSAVETPHRAEAPPTTPATPAGPAAEEPARDASPAPRPAANSRRAPPRPAARERSWWRSAELSPAEKVAGVLRSWLWIFVGVGLQMTWILGPFVGTPQDKFLWFHPPGEGNFLQGAWTVLTQMFG